MAFTSQAESKEYTNWSIYGKAEFNYNMHSTNGINIAPLCPECINLENGNGIGLGVGAGLLYNSNTYLLGMRYQSGLSLSYSIRSGKIENDKFLGNIIDGNEVKKGIVNYSIDNSVSVLEFEPFIYFYPLATMKTAFKLGLTLAMPITKNYTFSETAGTPNTTLPDGSHSKTYSETVIPSTSSIFLAIPIGLKYDVYNFDDFIISPEISYSIALTNFQSASKWNLNKFTAGISVQYQLSKTVEPDPVPAPMPEAPAPIPVITEIESSAKWNIAGQGISSNSDYFVTVERTDYYHQTPVLPFVFFDDNSAVLPIEINKAPKHGDISADFEGLQNQFLREMPTLLLNQENISISSYYLDTESPEVGQQRLNSTIDYLKSKGINADKIKTKVNIVKSKRIKYPEQAEEYRSVAINYSDINLATSQVMTNTKLEYPNIKLDVAIEPKSSAGIKTVSGKAYLGNKQIADFNSAGSSINITNAELEKQAENSKIPVKIIYTVTDNTGNSKEFTDNIGLVINQKQLPNVINYVDKDASNSYHEYVLALNSFDKQHPYLISEVAKNALLNAIELNKKVEILGLTDDFGNMEYNNALSERRVHTLLKELKIDSEKISIVSPEGYLFNNKTTAGKMLNRSVIIRVYDK